jgi:putative hydrolase of the HAD superfamily
MKRSIEVILFDLGGVLIELGQEPLPSSWLPGNRNYHLADWLASETAISFEKGQIDVHSFAKKLKSDLAIDVAENTIIQHISDWPIGLFPGAHELLDNLKGNFRLFVLSNTNELHWSRITDEFGIDNYVEHIFASHQLGMVKPELAIFQHVIDALQVEPREILFLDDNLDNIEASQKLGISGVHVNGIKQAKQALVAFGAVDA